MNGLRQQFRSLGALLMERGLLTPVQLDAALEEQKRSGEKLGRILVSKGWVRDKDILSVLQGMMVVVFQLRDEDYGVETLQVREIIRWLSPRVLPASPAWLAGVVDYRGQVVPVVDMAARLGRPPLVEMEAAARIVIYEGAAGRTWGLMVDSVSAVVQVGRDQLEDGAPSWQPAGVPMRWLAGLAKLDNRPVALLNMEEVLGAGEAEAAAALPPEEAA
jgi:purine-binding chemotaxis protein CheW